MKPVLKIFFLAYQNSINQNTFIRFEAGIFEEMFSGIGGEILFSKPQSRFATSASLHWAKKRDYDRGFNHLDYDAVTGSSALIGLHSIILMLIHIGQYLAKDKGRHLNFVGHLIMLKVGVWATQTDVSAEDFGEGSFDKVFTLKFLLMHYLVVIQGAITNPVLGLYSVMVQD